MPIPIEEADEAVVARDAAPEAVPDAPPEGLGLVKRDMRCKVLGSSTVKCRTGPRFNYSSKYVVKSGKYYNFDCYKSGDCYKRNWSVFQTPLGNIHESLC